MIYRDLVFLTIEDNFIPTDLDIPKAERDDSILRDSFVERLPFYVLRGDMPATSVQHCRIYACYIGTVVCHVRPVGTYSEEMVREFYASYATTLRGSISKRLKPIAQDPLTSTMRNAEQREAVILWLAKYIAVDSERVEVSPTKADNQLTWDKAAMVVALVAGVEIDFARMLLAEIHERTFKTSTTFPFSCLIFQLCRDSGVPIWHCDRLIHPTGTLDIGLIRDEANVVTPHREPQVEVPPLGADLADTVGQAQGGDPIIPDHSDTVPASSSQAASMDPSSSRSTPQLRGNVVPLAKVQKLETQMATLLHHIQPWMQKLIVRGQNGVKDGRHDGPEGPGNK
ncbi:hypothetical protein H5410_041542 [Solanum commersonii]|uniref:Putative plant transposon protein domain-containing protein n=1 Tax=Solanum commersonii TaxID=4109 RepID=A0A9J5XUV5_SOLCO|nr:hypothetical protein H5410_041542 [Solanum commersonii]